MIDASNLALAEASANESTGTVDEILAIARLLFPGVPVRLRNLGGAAFELVVGSPIAPNDLKVVTSIVRRAAAGGVRATVAGDG